MRVACEQPACDSEVRFSTLGAIRGIVYQDEEAKVLRYHLRRLGTSILRYGRLPSRCRGCPSERVLQHLPNEAISETPVPVAAQVSDVGRRDEEVLEYSRISHKLKNTIHRSIRRTLVYIRIGQQANKGRYNGWSTSRQAAKCKDPPLEHRAKR